jgi:hypothetical protein
VGSDEKQESLLKKETELKHNKNMNYSSKDKKKESTKISKIKKGELLQVELSFDLDKAERLE